MSSSGDSEEITKLRGELAEVNDRIELLQNSRPVDWLDSGESEVEGQIDRLDARAAEIIWRIHLARTRPLQEEVDKALAEAKRLLGET